MVVVCRNKVQADDARSAILCTPHLLSASQKRELRILIADGMALTQLAPCDRIGWVTAPVRVSHQSCPAMTEGRMILFGD